jgi:uncharacterized protein (UPF0218 family)
VPGRCGSDHDRTTGGSAVTEVIVELPDSLREELGEPAGPLYTDTDAMLAAAGKQLVTVGDVVTYHVLEAGVEPSVALVDERTERTAVDDRVADRVAAAAFDHEVRVVNPAATLTAELLAALRTALDSNGTTLLGVDGEEDLATLPAVVAAPADTSVVYGQPGEGMVLVPVSAATRERMRALLSRMDGDSERLFSMLRN